MSWRELDLMSEEGLHEARAFAEVMAREAEGRHLQTDLDWALAGCGSDEGLSVHVLGEVDDPLGYALMLRQDRPLECKLGEMTVARFALRRLVLWSAPLLLGDASSLEAREGAQRAFLVHVAGALEPGEALGIEGVAVDSSLDSLLARDDAVRSRLTVQRLGDAFQHHYVAMPDTLDAYLGQLSKRSRKSVQYSRRKLFREHDDAVRAECFRELADVERFADDAIAISRRTYQWQLLGLGLRNRDSLVARLEFAAREGSLRSYILYCAGAPVAFMLGYLRGGRYYYIDVGYDTEWADWSVGSVLQLEVMEDLYRDGDVPEVFDFSTGHGEHKARFANTHCDEVNYLLLPRTMGNALRVGFYRAVETASSALVGALEHFGVKAQIKRAVRRVAARRGARG